jgi:hypothetical protein
MFNWLHAIKFGAVILGAFMLLASVSAPSFADNGTVRFRVVKAGFIFGAGGGDGTLNFQGRTYPLKIGGLSAGTIGVSSVDVVGTARNLRSAADIAGVYSAIGAGAAVAGGASSARLQNAKGVVLDVRGTQVGFDLTLGLAGLTIALR